MGLLLAGHLGTEGASPIEVRVAAHLEYALHNEALALAEGASFDIDAALKRVTAIDGIVGCKDGANLMRLWANDLRDGNLR